MELGITPRRRGSVAKVKRAEKVARNSDRYIKPVSAKRPDNRLRVGYCIWPGEIAHGAGAGMSWHAASLATRIPYSTVRKHARLMGYAPRQQNESAG
jgi:hypothetical protein